MRDKLFSLCLPLCLMGCGSGSSSPDTFNTLTHTGQELRFRVPVEGGSVQLPAAGGVGAVLTFAPGAEDDTFMQVRASATPPPGAPSLVDPGPAVQTQGIYYLSMRSSRALDLSLIRSLRLVELSQRPFPNRPGLLGRTDDPLPDDAQHYRALLNDLTDNRQTFLQEIPGDFDPATQSAEFKQIQPVVLPVGNEFLVRAKATKVETLPTTLVNESGIEPAYFNILGRNPNPAGGHDPNNYYVTPEGRMEAVEGADRNFDIQSNNQGGFNGYTDLYNIPMEGTREIQLPQLAAGRIYFSLGKKLLIRLEDRIAPPPAPPPQGDSLPLVNLEANVNLAQPNGWGNPGDPNYRLLWDWVEFDYKVNVDTMLPGMGINKTEVDMFSLGIQIQLEGPTIGSATVGTLPAGRKAIFEAVQADDFFKSLIIAGPAQGAEGAGNLPIRIVAPKKALDNVIQNIAPGLVQTFDKTYFDDYLTRVWTKYESEDLQAFTSAFGRYHGRVQGADMVFTRVDPQGSPLPGFQKIHLRKPTTAEAFEPTELITSGGVRFEVTPGGQLLPVPPPPPGVRAPMDGDDPALFTPYAASEIVSALSAAMNRTTLLFEPLITRDYRNHPHDLLNFYRLDQNTNRINVYAKSIHDQSLTTADAPGPPNSNGGGAAYAFGFDDNSNQSSFLSENTSPTRLVIKLTQVTP